MDHFDDEKRRMSCDEMSVPVFSTENDIRNRNGVVDKLREVLLKLLQPNFKCSDDTILTKLFDCVTTNRDTKDWEISGKRHVLLGLFLPWIDLALSNWELIVNPVKSFFLKIVGYFSRGENCFDLLAASNIPSRIVTAIKMNERSENVSITMGYVELLQGVMCHKKGLTWIIDSGEWKVIALLSQSCPSIYILRKCWQVFSDLITKTEIHNQRIAKMMLEDCTSVLKESSHQTVSVGQINKPNRIPSAMVIWDSKEEFVIVNVIKLTIEIILNIMNLKFSFERINSLFESCKISDWAWTVMHNSDDLQMVAVASRLMCFMNALDLCDIKDHKVPQIIGKNFIDKIINHFNLLVTRHAFDVISDSAVDYQYLWEKYGGKVIAGDIEKPDSIDYLESEIYKTENSVYRVQNFLFIIQVLPLFVFCKVNSKELECDNLLELYIEKLFRVACPKTIRFCYSFRLQLSSQGPNLEKGCVKNIHKFEQLATICNKEQAVLVFQALIHIFKFIIVPKENPHLNDLLFPRINYYNTENSQYPVILPPLISALCTYLKKFDISWRDSLETVCIMSLTQFLLNDINIPPMLCTATLRLIKMILLKFMPPNLALLVNTLQGSSMQDLGKQLYKTLHSYHWEVRDSTIEVLTTISILAEAKFPAFQTLLIENRLPDLITSIMDCDSEPYVRASAICCISEMIKLQNIWDNYLQSKKLMEKIFIILHFESEGIVRKQAALLAKEIYKNRQMKPEVLEQAYNTFYHIAQNDLHWEVKINALEFWDEVIDFVFSEEGMVDGSFPQTIFSKEKKKIIQLTSIKTCHLVLKAVRKLSDMGCLHVLWATLLDECDLVVQKKSAKLITKLKDIVNKYDVLSELNKINFNKDELDNYHLGKPPDNLLEVADIDNMMMGEDENNASLFSGLGSKLQSVDDVINEIISEEDIQLLSGLVNIAEREERILPSIKRFIIPAEEFIEKIMTLDVETVLKEKISWTLKTSEGIESLLDDIIQFTEEDEFSTNAIDCY
ncbi:uncharacterized protein LOC106661957 [Cimex lectularius]|uniref:BRCA1-associated ATM activator 1 n=1 Tax=Cimex lectularius TaxID=79782 RepID=A0A8I6RB33_CIMLE|nr:uncharacterized protein LOC106661957 [Cimex lectularius]XP_014241223.1 uncharacterized protein LOC106661957 [Cimex lectularius]